MSTPSSPSLSREAYHVVRHRILRGELQLGQMISRRKLASELGMSFLPVSEALLRLEVEGLLESRPRAGTRVRIPSPEELAGHYVVREALETQAARLFAETSTAEERAQMLVLAQQVDAAAGGGRAEYLTLHEKLHRRIAELARCATLSAAVAHEHALASTWMCVGRGATPGIQRHQRLVEMLSVNDPSTAAEAMRAHIREKQQMALDRLAPYFDHRNASYTRGARTLLG